MNGIAVQHAGQMPSSLAVTASQTGQRGGNRLSNADRAPARTNEDTC
jgi:hypothetical protein